MEGCTNIPDARLQTLPAKKEFSNTSNCLSDQDEHHYLQVSGHSLLLTSISTLPHVVVPDNDDGPAFLSEQRCWYHFAWADSLPGIVTYCSSWKDHVRETRSVKEKADGLRHTLEALRDFIEGENPQNDAVLADVLDKVLACEGKIHELKEKLEVCTENTHSSSSRNNLQRVLHVQGKKALYPFRRDGLRSLKDDLDSLQTNLNTALQVDTDSDSVLFLKYQQNQTRIIISLSKTVSTETSEARREISGIGSSMTLVQKALPEIQSNTSELALKMDEHEQKINEMILTMKSIQQNVIRDPMLHQSLCNQQQQLQNEMQCEIRSTKRGTQAISRLYRREASRALECTCSRRSLVHQHSHASVRQKPFYGLRASAHDRSCPLYAFLQRAEHLEAGFTLINSYLGFSLQVVLSLTRGAGGCSISPRLNFRSIVPFDSPAFSCIKKIHSMLCDHDRHQQDILDSLKSAPQRLLELFSDGKAAPSDLNPYGETLLHVACELIPLYRAELLSSHFLEVIASLCNLLITVGVAPNAENNLGFTALDTWIFLSSRAHLPADEFVSFGLSMVTNGGYLSSKRHNISGVDFLRSKQLIKAIMERSDEDFVLSDIAGALYTQSEEDLRDAVSRDGDAINSLIGQFTVLGLSADWPRGIEILLEAGADIDQKDDLGYPPLDMAIVAECLPSVQLLLAAGCSIDGYHSVTFFHFNNLGAEHDITMTFIEALASRRRQLQSIAEQSLPEQVLAQLGLQKGLPDQEAPALYAALIDHNIPVASAFKVTAKDSSLYHLGGMTWKLADQLYLAGFHNIDDANDEGETPLMCVGRLAYKGLSDDLEYAQWLISRGADSYRRVPYSSASALHQLCMITGRHIIFASDVLTTHFNLRSCFDSVLYDEGFRDFLAGILVDRHTDECLCSCSLRGCRTWTKLLRSMFTMIENWALGRLANWVEVITFLLGHLLPKLAQDPEIVQESIRFMTFSGMKLRHTCCCFLCG
ncbi:hypothetical protein VTN77DRAFT_5539 [Rasamsonia byssochlamydoides]|uniref:uncharacterized protein n=1 Tax=Rasamsonia byssochlamydoides TaxID=89139 RepID=UPI0037448E94